MQFEEKFKFPMAAYEEFKNIMDNIVDEPDDDNLFNLPEWYKKKHGIQTTKDIEEMSYELNFEELFHFYRNESSSLEIGFEDVSGHGLDINAVCEILATVMKRHRVCNPVVIRVSVECDPNITKPDYGGIVFVIHPGLIRSMTTDDLARQMLERFA